MKNIKDLGPNEVIHCPTEGEAIAIVQLMRDNGGSWRHYHWTVYEEDTCYYPHMNQYCNKKYFERRDFIIHPAADFIENNKNNNNMTTNTQQVVIDIPEGFEIDPTNSDLLKGLVKFKPVKKALPTEWEDLEDFAGYYVDENNCDIILVRDIVASDVNRNVWPTKELAEASLALCQLVRLRDIYNEGWQANWSDDNEFKYCVHYFEEKLIIDIFMSTRHFLSFKDKATAETFSKTFADLILQAKPLL